MSRVLARNFINSRFGEERDSSLTFFQSGLLENTAQNDKIVNY
jgi:hypothetical protein